MVKIDALGETFFTMSEDEYGDWIDALPQEEFIELIAVMIELEDSQQQTCVSAAYRGKHYV
ncbi:hypothetical protein WS63_02980 [Burkholderia stagnalis]|nr:hypothetical protein [Burkholderia stagnalis]KVD94628.1 hypothetical protein WS63_02980 [Burkholderia stagnalis]KWN65907.1 hypothetical protein WT90_32970 [Burkholderia stagnalis]